MQLESLIQQCSPSHNTAAWWCGIRCKMYVTALLTFRVGFGATHLQQVTVWTRAQSVGYQA
jgi:hypothetical protein